jgi:hypothetical protein
MAVCITASDKGRSSSFKLNEEYHNFSLKLFLYSVSQDLPNTALTFFFYQLQGISEINLRFSAIVKVD